MAGNYTVKELIEHLQKYPSSLIVSGYRPPFKSIYRIMKAPDRWLYNTRRLYIPIEETKTVSLPSNYKIPKLNKRKKKNEQ